MQTLAHSRDIDGASAQEPGDDGRSPVWLAVGLAVAALPLLVLRGLSLALSWPPVIYVPLHAAVELAIVVVGFATSAVQWHAAGARGFNDARARFVGAAFLGSALLETVHLLVFPGMPGFLGPSSIERGIYYWLLARGWLASALAASAFISPSSDRWLLRRAPLFACSVGAAAVLIALEQRLPASPGLFFHPGSGLTGLKIALESCIAAVAVVGALTHLSLARADRAALRIAGALGIIALSEACFSLYSSAYDAYNLLGHLYALVAAALIFGALFIGAIIRPYERLDEATRDLAASNALLDALRGHVEGELAVTIARLEEASAREASARAELEAAIAAVPDAILAYAPDGSIARTNEAAQRLLGYTQEERDASISERWLRLSPQTTDGKPLTVDENPALRALRGEVVTGFPFSIAPPGRRRAWITVSAAPTRGHDGRLTGAVAAITDQSILQALQSRQEDLLRAVSHDLRNPLQIVLLQAERLQRLLAGDGQQKERTSAERIALAAKQMGVMIRDLVEAARMESGKLALALQPVELGSFVAKLVAQQAGALDAARVRVAVPAELPAVSADPARLERILTNLLSNALKYSPSDREVIFSAAERGGAVAISVQDGGAGIAADDLPHVFERFYRGKATQKADGLGLGLYIVQILVQAHGGRVWAESQPGEGAKFTFTLPRA